MQMKNYFQWTVLKGTIIYLNIRIIIRTFFHYIEPIALKVLHGTINANKEPLLNVMIKKKNFSTVNKLFITIERF